MGDLEDRFGKSFPAGHVVFREGERGAEMYVIHSGRVQITRTVQGRESVIAELPAGEFFGEMAILSSGVRSATATVMEDAKLIVIGAKQLEHMLRAKAEIAVRLIRTLSGRLEQANQQIELLLLKDANHRVVQCLRQLAESRGQAIQGSGAVFLPVSLAQLASRVGLDDAQVTDVLGRLIGAHLLGQARDIGLDEDGYVIPEVGRLQDFLEFLELRQRFG
jgi:CRP/FNR family cyclic AMP-dependent transcriptional regulator